MNSRDTVQESAERLGVTLLEVDPLEIVEERRPVRAALGCRQEDRDDPHASVRKGPDESADLHALHASGTSAAHEDGGGLHRLDESVDLLQPDVSGSEILAIEPGPDLVL